MWIHFDMQQRFYDQYRSSPAWPWIRLLRAALWLSGCSCLFCQGRGFRCSLCPQPANLNSYHHQWLYECNSYTKWNSNDKILRHQQCCYSSRSLSFHWWTNTTLVNSQEPKVVLTYSSGYLLHWLLYTKTAFPEECSWSEHRSLG